MHKIVVWAAAELNARSLSRLLVDRSGGVTNVSTVHPGSAPIKIEGFMDQVGFGGPDRQFVSSVDAMDGKLERSNQVGKTGFALLVEHRRQRRQL